MTFIRVFAAALLVGASVFAQTPTDPFPTPINATDVIKVNFVEFATLPDLGGQMPARPMLLVDEPGTGGSSSKTARTSLYVPRDGKTGGGFIDINDPKWGSTSTRRQRARISELCVPSAVRSAGNPGFGKFYSIRQRQPHAVADFKPGGGTHTHDTVLLEWAAKSPAAAPTTAVRPVS